MPSGVYLAFDPSEDAPIHTLLGHSITYRIVGFRLKGFRYVFNRFVQPAMKLKNDDFDPHLGASADLH